MTWETVDRDFGPEPGVFWDRDFPDIEWEPLLYSAVVGTECELRAHCPLHRAPDRWPVADGDFALTMQCMCTRWRDGAWQPRFAEAVRAEALDAHARGLIDNPNVWQAGRPGTAPFIRAALESIPSVLAVQLLDDTPGRVVAILVLESFSVGGPNGIPVSLIEQVAHAVMRLAVAAHVAWEIRTRIADVEESIRLLEDG